MNGKPYTAPFLPGVDYSLLGEEDFEFSLIDLEYTTFQNISAFLEVLKTALLEEKLIQSPELIIGHLSAYLAALAFKCGTPDTLTSVKSTLPVLVQAHAQSAFASFNHYVPDNTSLSETQRHTQINLLRDNTPGSIVAQTLRLGKLIIRMMGELSRNLISNRQQTQLFCSEDTLFAFTVPLVKTHLEEWEKHLDNIPSFYALNQLAVQLSWLVAYFSYLDKTPPQEGQYLECLTGCFEVFLDFLLKLQQSIQTKPPSQHSPKSPKANDRFAPEQPLLQEVAELSHKIQTNRPPAITETQKHIAIVDAGLQKAMVTLTLDGMAPKVMLMSLFYFWSHLEISLMSKNPNGLTHIGLESMPDIIELVKTTTQGLPEPEYPEGVEMLHAKMEQLKSMLDNPQTLDTVPKAQAKANTERVNAVIHTLISEYLDTAYHPEIIANCLFSYWLRFSVLFGVPESFWQKMDFYLPQLITKARAYLTEKVALATV